MGRLSHIRLKCLNSKRGLIDQHHLVLRVLSEIAWDCNVMLQLHPFYFEIYRHYDIGFTQVHSLEYHRFNAFILACVKLNLPLLYLFSVIYSAYGNVGHAGWWRGGLMGGWFYH